MNFKRIKKKLLLLRNGLFISYGFSKIGILKSLRKKGLLRRKFYNDIILISYPKSGRTWLRVMLDFLDVNLKYDHYLEDFNKIKNLGQKSTDIFLPKFSDKRIIFLTRDPRDTIVSSYFQEAKREQSFDGSISEFIRSPEFGIKSILDYQLFWIKNRANYSDFLQIQYEEMHQDIAKVLKRIFTFLGNISIDDKKLKKTVGLFQFENMQFFEKKGLLGLRYGNVLRPLGDRSADSLKVRKGVIGGYKNYLTEADLSYCNECISEMGIM
jgi:hypothetical protein